jgi:hypothetical protein
MKTKKPRMRTVIDCNAVVRKCSCCDDLIVAIGFKAQEGDSIFLCASPETARDMALLIHSAAEEAVERASGDFTTREESLP